MNVIPRCQWFKTYTWIPIEQVEHMEEVKDKI